MLSEILAPAILVERFITNGATVNATVWAKFFGPTPTRAAPERRKVDGEVEVGRGEDNPEVTLT